MFSRKKEPEKKKRRDLSQFGLFDISNDIGMDVGDNDDDNDDDDFEAELAAITAGKEKSRPKPKPKPQIPVVDLNRMVADSLKDIDDDDNLSGDDDDPDLLNELSTITDTPEENICNEDPVRDIIVPTTSLSVPNLINSRIEMYKIAESNAKDANDSGKARRLSRGLKTLEGLLKQANAGKVINMDDIPPEVTTKVAKPPVAVEMQEDVIQPTGVEPSEEIALPVAPIPPTPIEDKSSINQAKIDILLARQREYKLAALGAKKSGNTELALNFVKIIKMFDTVIKAAQDGQEIDLSDMPPPPSEFKSASEQDPQPAKEESAIQNASEDPAKVETVPLPEENLISASSILEALLQRLDKYKSVEQAAKEENNSSKARRFGRIIKQYEDAIKQYRAGKTVAYDELPTPPGFGPIPVGGSAVADAEPKPGPTRAAPPVPTVPPVPPRLVRPEASTSIITPSPDRPTLQKQESASRLSGNHSNTSVMNTTISTILERQTEFRNAAIAAKKANEIEQAKEYLKIYKGLENLLNVARGGLPIDLTTLPIPPSQRANMEDSFTFINNTDCIGDDLSDISMRLEEQLQKQLTMCKATRDHHKALGDVAGTNRFENLALSVQRDYDILKISLRKNLPVPGFHYEQKSFNIVRCNTDLTDSELEIQVVRGISYSVANAKDVDTYVKVEIPYPQETPFKARTQLVRDTDSPEYNEKFVVEIQPKQRHCQRVFKRQSIKFEIYSKGCCCVMQCCQPIALCCFSGFLRSDTLIGTVAVKLQPLETACDIHDSFNLMDGRKTIGGKLEVKIRIRDPIITKQIEHTNEKWLVIDS